MELVSLTPTTEPEWERLCAASPGAWFWHTRAWREYTVAYRPELRTSSLAFLVRDGGEAVGLMPLSLEEWPTSGGGPERQLTFGGSDCWAPALAPALGARRGDAVLRRILEHVRRLGEEAGAMRVALRVSPLVPGLGDVLTAFLAATTRAGFLDASLASQVVDLEVPRESLHRERSENHRRNIGRGDGLLDVDVHQGEGFDPGVFDDYRRLHTLAAGRVTRPAATFELMRDWLRGGEGALVRARLGGEAVGYAYLILHKRAAYYASGANHPDHATEPIGHAIHAAAIDWLQDQGYRRYELGLQQYGPLPHDLPDAKDLGIARFKRGFGGVAQPLVIRELFLDARSRAATLQARTSSYLEAVGALEERSATESAAG